MEINNLKMISFRNHKKTNISFDPGLTIIWGKNGSGKTSILEAIHSLSFGKSFRTNNKSDLIKNGEENFYLKGDFKSKNNSKNTVSLSQDIKGNKKITINQKTIKKRKELFGLNNVVVFSPEEEEITKGSPLIRRNYFDKVFSICSSKYLEKLLSYNKLIKQRNILLKTEKNLEKKEKELDIWDKPLSINGVELWLHRDKKINQFSQFFSEVVERFDKNLLLDINYKLKNQTKEDYLKVLKKSRADDISRGYTSCGPHRDDILFNWDKKKIKNHGSQGEHKLFLALLKISEHLFISQKTEKTPIFLIDDMFANLDKERSKKLLHFVETFKNKNEKKSQTIITTTNIVNIKENGFFSEYENIKKHHLEEHATT